MLCHWLFFIQPVNHWTQSLGRQMARSPVWCDSHCELVAQEWVNHFDFFYHAVPFKRRYGNKIGIRLAKSTFLSQLMWQFERWWELIKPTKLCELPLTACGLFIAEFVSPTGLSGFSKSYQWLGYSSKMRFTRWISPVCIWVLRCRGCLYGGKTTKCSSKSKLLIADFWNVWERKMLLQRTALANQWLSASLIFKYVIITLWLLVLLAGNLSEVY